MNPPVFVFASHRSGSTLLERILNAHPNLVLWGEHAGILNNFVEMLDTMARHGELSRPLPERGLGHFLRNKPMPDFAPWRTPVSIEGVRQMVREWMLRTFTIGLAPEQRWGIKEIRYGGPLITRSLLELFPAGQFVVLRRNLVDLCASNILAAWSLDRLGQTGKFETEEDAKAVISDCAYALTAMDHRLRKTAEIAGASAFTLNMEEVPVRAEAIFEFLRLPLSPAVKAAIASMIAAKVGDSDQSLSLGKLNIGLIKAWAPVFVAEAQRDIEQNGLDRERLLGFGPRGKYCFIVGDHSMRDTMRTSMGWHL
ncbi:MAG: sulfotransferase [Proteobacteria bacterium]|nr:sulfotransferase [Pseudomonadota bacterium]MBU6426178.1 sulfotransferase [Rhodospirillales bacterium]